MKDQNETKVRLSKRMSELDLCSRREADELIQQGFVTVNGEIVDQLGSKVWPTDQIEIRKKGQLVIENKVSLILNKPIGVVSHGTDKGYKTALDLIQKQNQFDQEKSFSIKIKRGLAPVGRLDIESQGLLLLTQDGRIAKAVIGENEVVEKEYLVRYQGLVTQKKLEILRSGSLVFDDRKLKPARVEVLNQDQLKVILTEGVKRQIRRMMEAVDLEVTGLKRVRIGPLRLGSLPEGQWRHLTSEEAKGLLENRPARPPKRRFPKR